MYHSTRFIAAAAALVLGTAAFVAPASAACTRLAFSVNDYGKDGPTRDAKQLLDKYVAKWAKDHGIGKYTTGKKDVSCELFLNFILFDEHTCKAEASVCWDGPAVPGVKSEAAATDAPASAGDKAAKPAVKSIPVKAAAKPAEAAKAAAPVETGSTIKSVPEEAPSPPAAIEIDAQSRSARAREAGCELTVPATDVVTIGPRSRHHCGA